jgi:hypothetical protein
MTERWKLVLAIAIPAVVLAALIGLFIHQSLILSASASETAAAHALVDQLDSENATLQTRIDDLQAELDQARSDAATANKQLQDCQDTVAQLRADRATPAPRPVALGKVDPSSGCITVINRTSESLDLAGWSLSSDEAGEKSYMFPSPTPVDQFDTFQVCIETYNPTGDLQLLYLQTDSGEVYLRDPDGTIRDQTSW